MYSELSTSMEGQTNDKSLKHYSNSKFLDTFYRAILEVFEENDSIKIHLKRDKLSFITIYVILYFQFTSLLWRPEMPISDWNFYENYWHILSYARVDTIIYQLNIQVFAYYAFSALIYATFITFTLIFFLSIKKINPPKIMKWMIGKALNVQNTVLFIPILTFFSILLSQSIKFSKFYVNENTLVITKWDGINCALCMVLHIFHAISCEYMSFEIRHCYHDKNFQSKASCATDVKRIISRIIIIELYCFISLDIIEWLHILCSIVCIWLGSMYIIYIPYYNMSPNSIALTKICCEFSTAICFIAAKMFNSAGYLLLANIIVIPLIGIMSPELLKYRYKLITKRNLKIIKNTLHLEIQLRSELFSQDYQSYNAIKDMNKYSQLNPNGIGLLSIWACNYCIYTLKDYRLAYIKLSRIHQAPFSLETSFQEFKCRRILKLNMLSSLEDLNFLNYILKLSKAKTADKLIAQIYIAFASEIVNGKPKISKLERYVSIMYKKLKVVRKGYEKLCEKYHNGIECQKLLLSFSVDICINHESLILNKLKFKDSEKVTNGALNYFDEDNGILLVSGEADNIGTILYANDQFPRIIGGSAMTLIGSDMSSLIPKPYSLKHNDYMSHFVKNCISSRLNIPPIMLFQTERGYLVECYVKTTLASLSDRIFFLIVARKLQTSRHAVLVNIQGLIYMHTEVFRVLTSSNLANFKDYYIQDIFPGICVELLDTNIPLKFIHENKVFYVVKTIKTIKSSTLYVLLFFNDETSLQEITNEEILEIKLEEASTVLDKPKWKIRLSNAEKTKVHFNSEFDEENANFGNKETNNPTKTQDNIDDITEHIENGKKYYYNDMSISKLCRGLIISIRYLILMKWLLIGVVLMLIASTFISTYFISEQIDFIKNDKLLLYHGNLINFILEVSVYINYNSLNLPLSIDYKEKLKNSLIQNDQIENMIFGERNAWKGCKKASSFFVDDTLEIFTQNKDTYHNKMNLLDFIKNYKKNVRDYLNNTENGLDATSQIQFLLVNGIIEVYNQLSLDFASIENCANHWVKDFDRLKNIILIVQISVVFGYLFLKIYKVYKIVKTTNLVWTKISENTFNAFYEIRNKCIHRLTTYLDTSEEEASLFLEYNRVNKSEFLVKFSQIWSYIWRKMAFLVVSILYFFLISLVLDTHLENLIQEHNLLKEVLFEKSFIIHQANFWTISSFTHLIVPDLETESFQDVIRRYENKKIDILNEKFNCFLIGKAGDYYYANSYESNIPHGLIKTTELAIIDSMYLFDTKDFGVVDVYSNRMDNLKNLTSEIILLVDQNGKDAIKKDFEYIISAVICYCLFCGFFYFTFYLPFLKIRIKHLRKMEALVKMFMLQGARHK
ncbi:hypothetical protein SteCoe_1518 [Stentor coeruleus]|uniref:PAS domain-containing protein n=1 Tax=Stentor coeruleus TaxID=5963 RepID=A0A1R2D1J9_9CILI|nr:hypothetical protein SteCoe_1518 [Stentor coeruleus]